MAAARRRLTAYLLLPTAYRLFPLAAVDTLRAAVLPSLPTGRVAGAPGQFGPREAGGIPARPPPL
jgi:hypothetical protein